MAAEGRSVQLACRVLEVSRSGYHAWATRPPSERAVADATLTGRIAQIHKQSGDTYGSPRVHAELRLADDVQVGRKRVERLMRAAGLSGQLNRRTGRTTISVPGLRTAPDLVERDFNPTAVDRLASVMDCYSRRIVGWAIADHMRKELVIDALQMAVARRRPELGVVHHSDHGSQYTSLTFTQRCTLVGIEVSNGSRGDCFDNAAIESFHASLKKDLIHRRSWPTKAEARTALFEYIETFYNRRRRHSRLGMLSPVDYENRTGTGAHTLSGTGAATRRAHTDQNISTTTSTAAKAA